MRWMNRRVSCGRYAGEAFDHRGGRRIEVLVGNAVNATFANGAEGLPVALRDYAVKRHTVTSAAPGEEEDVWAGCGNFFRRGA